MSDKYSKGPWRVAPGGNKICTDYRDHVGNPTKDNWISGGWAKTIAEIPSARWRDASQVRADANVIAAAPDLLESLQDLFDCGMERMLMGDGKDDQIEAIAKARAAIEKATGTAS